MTFAEYTKKRKEEEKRKAEGGTSNKSGGVQETVTSPSKDEKPKSFAEYTKKRKGTENKTATTDTSKSAIQNPTTTYAYGMTKAEYDKRRMSNPSMPEYGSYDYYKSREEALRPHVKEISEDWERTNDLYIEWVKNYNAGLMPDDTDEYTKSEVIRLANKFKRQDAITAEYKAISDALDTFEKGGIHYNEDGTINTASGKAESETKSERYSLYAGASAPTLEEIRQGLLGELPSNKQNEFNKIKTYVDSAAIESDKADAYNYYAKNKDNVYEDDWWGRLTGNYKVGRIGIKSNSAGYTSYSAGSDNIEASEIYQILSARIQNRNKETFKNNGGTDEIIATIGQYAPQGVDQAIVGLTGKAIGSLAGSGDVGYAIATAGYMYEQTAGATYVRLLQESDLSVEDAKELASNEAIASSIVEFGLDYGASKLWSKVGSKTPINNSLSKAGNTLTKELTSIGISEKGAKTILNTAKNAGKLTLHSLSEGTEEWWQEGISITADKYAAEGKTASPFKMLLQALWLPQYSKDDLSRMNQSFMGGAIIGYGHGGVNALSSYGMNKLLSPITNEKTPKPQNEPVDITINTESPKYAELEARSQNNEPITVEDVKKATAFGDEGAKLVTELANRDGETFSRAVKKVESAYLAGYTNVDGKKLNFTTEEQINAFTAGKKDRAMQDIADKENAKDATVYDGTFTENEYTKDWSKADKKMVSTVAKSFGMDVSAVDKIIASVTVVDGKEIEHEANASHLDGEMQISSTAEKVIHELVLHEGGHRMKQLAPTEFGVLMDALYERAMRRNAKLGLPQTVAFDNVKREHDNAGLTRGTGGHLEEFAVRELETIFGSAEEFNKWYAKISGNQQLKTNFDKFVDWILEVIDDIKLALAKATMSISERSRAYVELDRIKERYTNTYKASENAVTERRNEMQKSKSAEAKVETATEAQKQPVSSENKATHKETSKSKESTTKAKTKGIKAGDVFVAKDSNLRYKIVSRDDKNTSVEIASEKGTKTMVVANEIADRNFINMSDEGVVEWIDEDMHIDNRTWEDVGNRKVKAFQFLFPEFKEYYTPLAQELLGDLDSTIKGERILVGTYETGQEWTGVNRVTSDAIAQIKDATNATYDDIRNALNRLINDEGQENIALAKKIELVFDEMLTDGYNAFDGTQIPANEEYIARKEELHGKTYEGNNTEDALSWLDDMNFSLKGFREDGIEVYETSEEVKKMSVSERKRHYVQLMNNEYAGRTARFVRNGHTYYAEFDRKNLKKAMYGDNRSSKSGKKALTRVGADGDVFDLVENSTYSYSKPDTKNHKKADYFDYFIKTVQIDNKVYDLLADVKKQYNKNGGYVYTLVLKDNKKIKVAPTKASKNDALQGVETTSKGKIPQNPKSVKTDFSLKDSDYLKAVKNGDLETAQRMVDQKAKESRFPTKVYHGTTGFGWTKADVRKSDDGISVFATDSLALAQTYSGAIGETAIKGKRVSAETEQRYNNLVASFVDKVNEIAGTDILNADELPFDGYLSRVKKGKMSSDKLSSEMTKFTMEVIDKIENISQENDTLIWKLSGELENTLYGMSGQGGNYGLYANTDGFLEVDGNGSKWSSIPFDKIPSKTTANTREIVKWAKDNGYSGVLFKNIIDIGYHGTEQRNPANVYAFLNPQEQLKSADPVTYDALGRVIPLEKRFNSKKNEIRYSLKDSDGNTLTEAQQEYFKDSKVRDENGNLLVVYHGSPSKFTVFNHRYLNTRGNSHGRGFYFTEKKSLAEGYEKEGGQLLKGYLNITKPLSEDKKTMTKADLLKIIKATCKEDAKMLVVDGGYDNVQEALRDTWISNCVNTYEMSMDNAYREVLNVFWNGNDNDVELISDLTNSGAGNENTLRQVYDVLGYDGVIYTAPDGTHEFVSLVSEQFKSIDNANPTNNPDIRFSLKDSEYLKAVESGDTETASKLIEEAAEKAFPNSKVRGDDGELKLVYHGTVNDFTVFDRQFANIEGDFGKGYYFTSNEYDVEANYANEDGPDLKNKIARLVERMEYEGEYADLSYEEREEIARQKFITSEPQTITAYLNMENPVYITPDEHGTFLDYSENYDEETDEYGEPEGLLLDFIEALKDNSYDYAYNDVDFSFLYEYAYDNGGVYASDAVKTIKHRIVDELADENGDLAINEVIRLAFEQIGFDGIIDTSVYYKFRNMDGMDSGTTHYIVFNANQIKSADIATYDNKGNVIPLSERFNRENDDIRYSLKDSEGKTLTAEQQEYFKDSKIRDKDGNLLVMYHGTTRGGFTVFGGKKDYWYFTNDKKYAYTFEGRKKNGQFYPFTKERMEKGQATPQRYKVYLNVTNPYIADIDTVEDALYWDKSLAGLLREKGYDALMVEDMSQVVVLNANQIKNTTNKNPSANPDINFSLKGGISNTELLDTIDDMRKGKRNATAKLAKYVNDGVISTKLYTELIEKYGAISSGEKPHRDVQVPQKTARDKKVSQTVRTILEAKATPDEAVPTIEKMVEDGIFSYDVYTDKQAINDADSYIKEYGWEESLDDWLDDVEKGVVSKQHTAMGWALYNNAANTAATTTSETERTTAIKTSLKILDAMVRHQRSAAQALQATRILKKLSPETQLYGVQKSVSALQKELTDRYGKKAPDLKIDEELAEQFINAKTPEERAEIEKEIYKDIGRQMPSRFVDKWNAWRYLAMLGNLRTHVRNVVGNAGFAPVVVAKDMTASAIESVVNRVSTKKMVRGKSIITGNKADRALLKAAWGDYSSVADMITNGGKYNDSAIANQHIEEGRKIFKSKLFAPVEWARKKNSALLEVEDMWFAQPHYAYALAQYCKANNITAEQIQRGNAIAPARAYAIKEAQKATYRDTNTFSQMVSEWGRSKSDNKGPVKKVFSTVIEGILPFRKTPANILVRGVEYSPLGLLKGLSYDLYQVGKGKMTATEAIDNISAGLTGTGLLALGVYLAAQGLIRGHGEDDEDEKEFKELMGHQSYALELPNGQSITLDWLAPEALPFFVGVNIWESTKGSDEEVSLSTILKAVSNISEPMLEMSCLQSLNDLFEGIGYASSNDTSGLVSILSSAVTSYLTQGLPTLFGQAERTGEENRMTTYTEKNNFFTTDIQYTLGKASAKIPFWDYNQIPYIDAWGRKEASGTALKRGFNNFLNPSYTSTIDTSDVEKELLRLYEQTGEGGVFPSRADKYFIVDGVRKDLTAEEYERYATLKGENSYKLISDLMESKEFKNLDDEGKIKAIDEAYTYADQKAKQAISNYKPDAWVKKADEFGSNVDDYLSFRANVSDTKADNGGQISKQEVVDIITELDVDNDDAWKMYLSQYESKTALEAEKFGINAELFMSAVVDMSNIKADYNSNGKAISGSRRAKIERYLNSVCGSYKEYLFLLGTEYDSVKDDHDYIQYFGK